MPGVKITAVFLTMLARAPAANHLNGESSATSKQRPATCSFRIFPRVVPREFQKRSYKANGEFGARAPSHTRSHMQMTKAARTKRACSYRNAYPLRPRKKSGALLHVSAENGTTYRSRYLAYPRREPRNRRNERASHCITAPPPTTLGEGFGHEAHFSFSCLFFSLFFHSRRRERRRNGDSPSSRAFLPRSSPSRPLPPRGGFLALLVTTSMNDCRWPRCVRAGSALDFTRPLATEKPRRMDHAEGSRLRYVSRLDEDGRGTSRRRRKKGEREPQRWPVKPEGRQDERREENSSG